MSNKDHYQTKLATIRSIPDREIMQPHNIPMDAYIQEADSLYVWCQKDKDMLTGAGLSWELVEDLRVRNGALIESEAMWYVERKEKREASRRWKKESPLAYRLRKQLFHDFRYAFRKNPMLLSKVKSSVKSKNHAGMIQDLNDLAVLGERNPELLEAIGFDMSLLDKAARTSKEMAKLLAQTTTERMEYSETKRTRDQAYTHLKEAIDEIYQCGRYVFRNDKRRLRGYRSQHLRTNYLRRKRAKKKGKAPKESTPNDLK